jgi:hypothetical protein
VDAGVLLVYHGFRVLIIVLEYSNGREGMYWTIAYTKMWMRERRNPMSVLLFIHGSDANKTNENRNNTTQTPVQVQYKKENVQAI